MAFVPWAWLDQTLCRSRRVHEPSFVRFGSAVWPSLRNIQTQCTHNVKYIGLYKINTGVATQCDRRELLMTRCRLQQLTVTNSDGVDNYDSSLSHILDDAGCHTALIQDNFSDDTQRRAVSLRLYFSSWKRHLRDAALCFRRIFTVCGLSYSKFRRDHP